MLAEPNTRRYETMPYRRCGRSGLMLPPVSLGLWHNFGAESSEEVASAMIASAFDVGITHFDLANNYGPPPGSAEQTLGKILRRDFGAYRDEMVISTKAGYRMGPGPYGDGGSRKYLLASLDASLSRLGVEYVDVFYHHRPDPTTPLEETMGALASAVQSGKALYAALSNYDPGRTLAASALLREMKVPFVMHQPRYSILDRRPEEGLLDVLDAEGLGAVVFSPLEQGLLSGRYLKGIPTDSRAARGGPFLRPEHLTEEKLKVTSALAELAKRRGQSPSQLALAWVLRRPTVASAIIGASRPEQILECVKCLQAGPLSEEELSEIDRICGRDG